jgi:hypothetical protein
MNTTCFPIPRCSAAASSPAFQFSSGNGFVSTMPPPRGNKRPSNIFTNCRMSSRPYINFPLTVIFFPTKVHGTTGCSTKPIRLTRPLRRRVFVALLKCDDPRRLRRCEVQDCIDSSESLEFCEIVGFVASHIHHFDLRTRRGLEHMRLQLCQLCLVPSHGDNPCAHGDSDLYSCPAISACCCTHEDGLSRLELDVAQASK